jgi:serine/threonine protein kinase
MTPERHELISKLFLDALAQETGQRAAFLDNACAGDEALRAEVDQWLVNDARAGIEGFIEEPSPVADLVPFPAPPDPMIGRRIGAYEINRRIGGGGMGDVYLAVRKDDIQLRVAVKLVRRGMDSAEIVRRFRTEWQILAALRHPNIARFLDCGTTEEGLPYLVMEYIDGKPIDEYCDDRRLTTRQRLELFRSVCAAVLCAHQHGVIHRDLSPDNIRVTDDGVPKLLDFGIAKLINPELGFPPDEGPTRTEYRFMKPEYASPEQVRGEVTFTTATDVYSLGVVLYRLLAGHPPYRIKSRLKRDIEMTVCETEPAPPSSQIQRAIEITRRDGTTVRLTPDEVARTRDGDPKKLRRSLAGDVDKIVLMALRKEAARRYEQSVEKFAADIEFHLKGLPVSAERDTLGYRARKFIKRNRIMVTAGALVLLSLVGGIVGTTTGMLRARDAEGQARNEAAAKQAVLEFFQDHVLAAARPGGLGIKATIRDAVNAAEPKIAEAFQDRPLVEAAIRNTLGVTYQYLRESKAAIQQHERALAVRRDHLGADHADTLTSMNNLVHLG